jgi:hypothetical protein
VGDRQCYGIRFLRDESPKSRCEYPYWRALRADARLRIPGGCLGLWISGGVLSVVGGWECRRITGQRPELVDRSLPACPLGGLLGLSRSLPLELREGRARFSSHVMPSDCRPGRAGYEVLMPLGGTRSASWPLRSTSCGCRKRNYLVDQRVGISLAEVRKCSNVWSGADATGPVKSQGPAREPAPGS